MKFRGIVAGALAFALSVSLAFGQVNQGTSPLTPAKGGTNSAFVGFAGPASSVKTFTLPNASDTIATLAAIQTFSAAKTFNNATLLLAGSSSGTTTLIATAAASGTLTLPAATDTLVGKATTDTLTNKTLTSPTLTTPSLGVATATSINKVAITAPATSATLTIPDGVTLTGPAASGTAMTLGNTETVTGIKTFGSSGAVGRLKVAGTTSGSTVLDATAVASGTLTLPAATDTLVGKATTDTLTNKTLTSPALTGTPTAPTASPSNNSTQVATTAYVDAQVSSGVSGVSSIAGNTGVFTLSNGITNSVNDIRLASIAAGTVLGNKGTSSAIPTAQSVPVLLNTLTASASATLGDTTSFSSTYSAYDIVFTNLLPATNAVQAELQVHSGGSFQATTYVSLLSSIANVSFSPSTSGAVTTYIPLSVAGDVSNASGSYGVSGTLRIHGPVTSATFVKSIVGLMTNSSGGVARLAQVSGMWNNTPAITGFQFLFSSGNITSGTIKIYGIP